MPSPFDAPDSFVFRGPDLLVALASSSAQFDFDWASPATGEMAYRLRVNRVIHGINDRFPRAELSLNMSGEFVGDGQRLIDPLSMGAFNKILHPDTLLTVYAQLPAESEGGGPASSRFIFAGYPNVQSVRFTSDASEIRFECTSLLERLAREAWVQGRIMHQQVETVDELPQQLCEALPCVFNANGRPNRAAELLTVEVGEDEWEIPLFTYDGDPTAAPWKYADVLTYLLWWYLRPLSGSFLQDGNGISYAQDITKANEDPTPIDSGDFTLDAILGSAADELVCQGQDLVSALLLLCRSAGLGMQQWVFNDPDPPVYRETEEEGGDDAPSGVPGARLLFWSLAEGGPWSTDGVIAERGFRQWSADSLLTPVPPIPPRELVLQPDGFDMRGKSPSAARSDVIAADLVSDASGVIASVEMIGATHLYEMGLGYGATPSDLFKPLWAPDATFGDELSGAGLEDKLADIEAISAQADGTPLTLFSRYTVSGAEHMSYRHVGRLWGLNEAGEYKGEAGEDDPEGTVYYGRSNGGTDAYAADRYAQYNFHVNAGSPRIADGEHELDWLPRRRRLLRPLSRLADGQEELRPIVHASWDGGAHWYEYPGNVRFLDDQCALLLTDADLSKVRNESAPEDEAGHGDSVWAAIVKGTFRIAVTATVEGDERVRGAATAPNAFSSFVPTRQISNPELFRFEKRLDSSRCVGDEAFAFEDVDDSEAAESAARRCVEIAQARLTTGTVVSPWLRVDWLPGDRVRGIQPRGVEFAATKSAQVNAGRWPQVVGVEWINTEANQATRLVLDDERRAML